MTCEQSSPQASSAPQAGAVLPPDGLEAYAGLIGQQATSALNSLLVHLGDRLGLWKALAAGGPTSASRLATRTGLSERLLREWLSAQAANGLLSYEAEGDRFTLPPAGAAVLADEDSPALFIGAYQMLAVFYAAVPDLEQAFRTGSGYSYTRWADGLHDAEERFTRPFHHGLLVDVFLAGVPGLVAKLEGGATVADVGCGYGTSTVLLAERFPASRFVGFDIHDHAIARAREAASRAGVDSRVRFEVAAAADIGGDGYDLVLFCDSLHDMGHPVAAALRARQALAPGGMLVTLDPAAAGDSLAENLADPMAAAFYAVSTVLCTPAAMSQPGGHAYGAMAGERLLRDVLAQAGFDHVERFAPDAPLNMVLAASDTPFGS